MTHLASPLQCPAQRLPWRWTGVLGSTMPACGYAHVFLGLLHVCQSCALCPGSDCPLHTTQHITLSYCNRLWSWTSARTAPPSRTNCSRSR